MKQDILKNYVKLRTSLETERHQIRSRLSEIEAALGVEITSTVAEVETVPTRRGPGRPKGAKAKRKLSPANKAKLIAGIKARWARYRAEKAGKAAPKAAKAKKKFSLAARAALSAAAKARWAKAKKAGKSKL